MSTKSTPLIHRNDPCPCGSGRRYKHCCATKSPAGDEGIPDYPAWRGLPVAEKTELWQTLQFALAAQVRGDLSSARDLYSQVLARSPDTFDAQHMLGVVYHQTGRLREAYQHIRTALDLTNWQVATMRHNLDLVANSLLALSESDLLPPLLRADDQAPPPTMSPCALSTSAANLQLQIVGEPLVTAIVSTYASADFIRECLDDLVAQTEFHRMEVIVVDACSPEDEKTIVEEYQRDHPNICYIRTDTRVGVYAAWNIAIHAARGKYIAPFSTNDRLRPEAYGILARALEENADAALVYGNTILTKTAHQSFDKHDAAGAFNWNSYSFEELTASCAIGPHPMWRRSLHAMFGYFDEQYTALGDQEFWLRIGEKLPMLHVTEVTGLYWETPDALSGRGRLPRQEVDAIHSVYRRRYVADLAEWRRRVRLAAGLPWTKAMFVARFGALPDGPLGHRALGAAIRESAGGASLYKATASADGEPALSVIVSTYNSESLLRPCLEDLARQTIAAFLEIIIIDSGSPQNEWAIAREFERRFRNFVYLRTERETLYAAWNRGIRLARGRYITNANTDDAHRPDALECLVAALEAVPEADFGYSDYAWSTRPNDSFDDPQTTRVVRHPPYQPVDAMFYCILGCHPIWRRTVFEELGLFDPHLTAAGDYEFLLRLIANGRKPVHVPEVLSLFHQNPEGLSFSSKRALQELVAIFDRRRAEMPIECLYGVAPDDGSAVARAWTALGVLATGVKVPWQDELHSDLAYAKYCFARALAIDKDCEPALRQLAVLAMHSGDQETAQALLARMPSEHQDQLRSEARSGQYTFRAPDVPPVAEPLTFAVDTVGSITS